MGRVSTHTHGRGPLAIAFAAALATAGTLALAPGASGATGGTEYFDPPVISNVQCRSGCMARPSRKQRRASRTRVIVVREGGVLAVRGRNLGSVSSVVFVGGRSSRDDTSIAPRSRSAGRLEVVVPKPAMTGWVKLVDTQGVRSNASREWVRVFHPPAPPPPPIRPGGQGLVWPISGVLTSPFGENRGDHFHAGIDIGAPGGTPVKAAAAGRVIMAGNYGGYGNFTCIAHSTISTCYAHMSAFAASTGQPVASGQVIGYVGNTGNSFGNHLHFEVREGTQPWAKPLNPLLYLPAKARKARVVVSLEPQDFDLPVYGP